MNTFISPERLPYLSEMTREKELRINSLINNLKISDVKDDKIFENTISRIKKEILLIPVVIGEPKFIDHEYNETPLTMQQQFVGGGRRDHYIHKISFLFTGNKELFSHQPDRGFSFSMSDHGLILPERNMILVEVDLPVLNPENAISEARRLLTMTFQIVESNNESIKTWLSAIEQRIDNQLKQKREELIKLFGDK